MNIYVASSWRNEWQPEVVQALRGAGHEVYDFHNPEEQAHEQGLNWADIDADWGSWSSTSFIEALGHPLAEVVYRRDFAALTAADAAVLVMPCGRSAHLELGYAVGMGKPTIILLSDGDPELMYKMVTTLVTTIPDLLQALESL